MGCSHLEEERPGATSHLLDPTYRPYLIDGGDADSCQRHLHSTKDAELEASMQFPFPVIKPQGLGHSRCRTGCMARLLAGCLIIIPWKTGSWSRIASQGEAGHSEFRGACVCLYVGLSACLSACLPVCLAVFLSVCRSVRPSVCLCVPSCVCVCLRGCVCMYIYIYVCVCLSVCLSVGLGV